MKRTIVFLSVFLLAGCATLKTSAEFIARGNGYVTDGKPEQAIKCFNRAIALNPNNMEAYEARGAAYFFNGDYEKAMSDFTTAINANPNDSNLYTAYASAAAAVKDYANALKALELAAQINAYKPEIYLSRGNIYYLLGRYDLAVTDFTTLLNLAPANEVFNARAAALIKLGKNELASNDLDVARSGKYPDMISEYAKAR